MEHRIYTTSEKAWTAMLETIRAAKHSIYLESYIFLHDTFPTHNFVEVLAERAKAGVRVKIVIDGLGSYSFGTEEQEILKKAGVELLFFTYWFRRIHRKVLVIDESVAFLGGVNVGKSYIHWLDLHIRITGQALIQQLLRSFAVSYRLSGGLDPIVLSHESKKGASGKSKSWILEHRPTVGRNKLRSYYKDRIMRARQSITIVSPYFLPARWLLHELRGAAKRGVRIEVLLPKVTNPAFLSLPNLFFAAALYTEGVRFYFSHSMNHAKALLVDEEGLIGSQNIDAQSFDFNAEVGVGFKDKRMVKDLRDIIEEWKSDSEEFTHEYFRRRWYHAPLEFLARILQPIL